jgi:hypothetical protein
MLNFKEIFKAWVTLSNPTEQQTLLANARFSICEGCQYKIESIKKKKWSLLCGKCGCPLKAKIFSDAINPCPMGYWKEIDKNFGTDTDEKNKKSII